MAVSCAGWTMRGEATVDPQAVEVGGGDAQHRRGTGGDGEMETECRRGVHLAGGDVNPKSFHGEVRWRERYGDAADMAIDEAVFRFFVVVCSLGPLARDFVVDASLAFRVAGRDAEAQKASGGVPVGGHDAGAVAGGVEGEDGRRGFAAQ